MKLTLITCALICWMSADLSAQSTPQQAVDAELARVLAATPHPESVSDFQAIPHLSARNQDTTLICWCFATLSFLESEMKRLGLEPVRLSVMYPVHCVFLEKAKRFVATKGESRFAPGDLFSGVMEIVQQYGAIPAASYEGLKGPATVYSHSALYAELDRFTSDIRKRGAWNEDSVLTGVRSILAKHLGTPPAHFMFKGKEQTPTSFLHEIVRLPWEEYLLVTSFTYAPFDRPVELRVPDNWAHRTNFINVPLEVFYDAFRDAVKGGYSIAFDADISESSYERTKRFCFIPPSDCPGDSIGQAAREVRFADGRTTDDHLMHAVSCRRFGSEDWFLAKDSWRTAFEGPNGGYMFFHSSYIRMKVLAFLVHRDGVPAVTARLSGR